MNWGSTVLIGSYVRWEEAVGLETDKGSNLSQALERQHLKTLKNSEKCPSANNAKALEAPRDAETKRASTG